MSLHSTTSKLPRCFFLHIPKCGGTALQYHLRNIYRQSLICPAELTADIAGRSPAEMSHYRLFCGHYDDSVRQTLPKDLLSVVVLRDPVARAASVIRYQRHLSGIDAAQYLRHSATAKRVAKPQLFRGLDVTAMLSGRYPDIYASVSNTMTRCLAGRATDNHINLTKQHLESAKVNLRDYTIVGSAENLQEVLDVACGLLQAPLRKDIRLNTTPAAPDTVSAAEIAMLEEHNALDVELFAYAKQLFCKPNHALHQLDAEEIQSFSSQAAQSTFQATLDTVEVIDGWWPWETTNSGNGHRWTGPASPSSMNVPADKRQGVNLALWISGYVDENDLRLANISADGTVKPAMLVSVKGGIALTASFNGAELDKNKSVLWVELYLPNEHKTPCGRRVGVAFRAVTVRPATASRH